MSCESEAMVEVVDGWLRKLYPKVPTWKEIADLVEQTGHRNLAYSLRQVYTTGEQFTVMKHHFHKSIQ